MRTKLQNKLGELESRIWQLENPERWYNSDWFMNVYVGIIVAAMLTGVITWGLLAWRMFH